MTGGASIGARAIADPGLRALPTEWGGPRPPGTRDPATAVHEARGVDAQKP